MRQKILDEISDFKCRTGKDPKILYIGCAAGSSIYLKEDHHVETIIVPRQM